ncbi:MAG: AAA family ATPase, partial [Phycisphaerae bacterium]
MIRKASKENVRLRIANCGESNSGKTFSALILAQEIASSMSKVVIIDTENRADLYEEHFQGYGVIDIAPPFDPEKAIEALDECAKAGAEFVIFDSASD